MSVKATQVKELRNLTQAPMMACKKALEETNGNVQDAIQLMREKGEIKAQQKSSRLTAEGVVAIAMNQSKTSGIMVEVNSETDFVAKDDLFNQFVENIISLGLSAKVDSVEALSQLALPNGETVEQSRLNLISKIGENINIRRLALFNASIEGSTLGHYLHGTRIGVIVEINQNKESLAKDIAMHVAASKPQVVSPDDVPEEMINNERSIYLSQARESGKPDNIIEKMVEGRVKKFLDEVSLVGQPYVKDPNQTVSQLLKTEDSKVLSFMRYEVGEGIEKKSDNFAEEVMSQVKS